METIEQRLYAMKLFEVMNVEDTNLYSTAMRVPGGWVIRSYDKSTSILGSVFVPFSDEFQVIVPDEREVAF